MLIYDVLMWCVILMWSCYDCLWRDRFTYVMGNHYFRKIKHVLKPHIQNKTTKKTRGVVRHLVRANYIQIAEISMIVIY